MTIFVIIPFPLMFAQFKTACDEFTVQTTFFAKAETAKEYSKAHLSSKSTQHANTCSLLPRVCHVVIQGNINQSFTNMKYPYHS